MSSVVSRWILGLVVVIQATLLVYSAKVHSPSWDETGHLAAGISHWKLGRFELYSVNPPLVRTLAAAPVLLLGEPEMDWSFYRSDPKLRTEVLLGRRMVQLNGEQISSHFFLARLAVIPIALIGTLLCFIWGRDLFDAKAGLLAAFLWALCPMVLAYGAVISPDLASAVALLGASYAAWRWFARPDWLTAACLSVTLAFAMLTKSVWLVLPAILVGVWGLLEVIPAARVKVWRSNGSVRPARAALLRAGQLTTAVILCFFLVNVFYGFQGSFKPLGEFEFISQSFAGPPICQDCPPEVGNRFADTMLAGLLVPLPANYVNGIDIQRRDFEAGLTSPAWRSYLFGEWRQGGWWYYYLVGLFVKTPLVLWCLVVAASIAALYWKPTGNQLVGVCCLAVPALILLLVLSVNTGLNRYVRYALPVLPVVVIWTSQLGRWVSAERNWRLAALAAACSLFAFVSVSNTPNWMSYFNLSVGGPTRGYLAFNDSNADWGQDLLLLKNWLAEHPEASENLHLAAFSSYDPADLGIKYQLPPPLYSDTQRLPSFEQVQHGPHPGWYVVSKNYLTGHPMPVPDGTGRIKHRYFDEAVFRYFNTFTPVTEIGNSMMVYHISEDTASDARQALEIAALRSMSESPDLGQKANSLNERGSNAAITLADKM